MTLPVIGYVGGGQLCQMTCEAIYGKNLARIIALDPDPYCSAVGNAEDVLVGKFEDPDAIRRLAKRSDILTYEIEKVTEIDRIMGFGVMSTPALVVDGVVKLAGKVPAIEDMKKLLD